MNDETKAILKRSIEVLKEDAIQRTLEAQASLDLAHKLERMLESTEAPPGAVQPEIGAGVAARAAGE